MRKRALAFLALGLLCGLGAAAPAMAAQPLTLSGQTYAYIPPAPRWIGAVALTADASKTVTLPTFPNEPGRKLLVTFMPPCADLYLRSVVLGGVTVGGAASIATGDVSDGTASLRNPGSLIFGQGDQVALISPTDCNVPFRVDLVTD